MVRYIPFFVYFLFLLCELTDLCFNNADVNLRRESYNISMVNNESKVATFASSPKQLQLVSYNTFRCYLIIESSQYEYDSRLRKSSNVVGFYKKRLNGLNIKHIHSYEKHYY